MKKYNIPLLLILILVFIFTCSSCGVKKNYKYDKLDKKNVSITEYVGKDYLVEVPKKIGRYNVVQVDDNAFISKKDMIEEIIYPDVEIKTLSSYKGFSKLRKIVLPKLERLEDQMFEECSELREIIIPSTVEFIGKRCFYKCVNLREINIPSSVKTIYEEAFSDCYKLENVCFNEGLENIYNDAFKNTIIDEIIIPSTIKNIINPFTNNYLIEKIDLSFVTALESFRFQNTEGVKEVLIPSYIEVIEDNAFSGCIRLEQFTFPESIKTIGKEAFSDCHKLLSIKVPSTLEDVSWDSFIRCYKMMYIESDINLQVHRALKTATNYTNLHNSLFIDTYNEEDFAKEIEIVTIKDFVFLIKKGFYTGATEPFSIKYFLIDYIGEDSDIKLPPYINDERYTVSSFVFAHNHNIKSIYIPETVIEIDFGAFYDTNLESLSIYSLCDKTNKGNEEIPIILGYYFGTDYYFKQDLYVPSTLKTLEIRDGIVDSDSFYGLNIDNIILGNE